MAGSERWAPLFPLGLVLFPREQLPLHIFEPRYRAMTERCERESIPFGVVLARDAGLAEIGCEAWIEQTLQRYSDGRRDIMTVGGDRIRVRAVREHADGYLEGRVELVEDGPGEDGPDARPARDLAGGLPATDPEPGAGAMLLQLYHECRRLQRTVVRSLGDAPNLADSEDEIDLEAGYTFSLAARIQMGPGERQGLLELQSESMREHFLLSYLARLRSRLDTQMRNVGYVKRNGKAETRE